MEKTRENYPAILREIALFASAALISTGILVWVLRLWQADLRVPFHYADDALFHTMLIKGIMENGWSFRNAFIGMPTGQTLYDFPIPENLHILGLKLLVLCTHNVALTLNLYYLLSFPLTTLCALYVFRKLRISSLPAVVASLLFTFLPYHFLRGVDHLFLATYFIVPFAILLSVWVCFDQDLLLRHTAEGKTRINFTSGKTRLALIVCVLLGSIGGYYAFFSCFFILLAGIFGLTWYKDAARVRTGIILCEIIAFTLIFNALPNIYLALAHGSNHAAILRPRISGECFPLKVTQLVLPATGHRLPSFAALKSEYNDAAPLVNENDFSTLGVVISLGFIALLLCAFSSHPMPFGGGLLSLLSALNIAGVLLAVTGGIGSLLTWLNIAPFIRSYNRVSIYLAFFSLLALMHLYEELRRRYVAVHWKRSILPVFLLLGLVVGALDQTNKHDIPAYRKTKIAYARDARFIHQIERKLPVGAMVFQVPYVSFPEGGEVNRMHAYDPLRAYLHSQGLRWSAGAMRGRKADRWQQSVARKPAVTMVQELRANGFKGIYLDRWGYADNGDALCSALTVLLGTKPLESEDHRLSFFSL